MLYFYFSDLERNSEYVKINAMKYWEVNCETARDVYEWLKCL